MTLVVSALVLGTLLIVLLAALAIGVSVGALRGGYSKPSRLWFWRRGRDIKPADEYGAWVRWFWRRG